MSQVIIAGDTSGTITLQAPAVSGSTTLTLPAATGTVMVSGNMPAFSAYATSNQSLSSGANTKILFDTEDFDTNNNFASSRFTPTVAGYYQLNSNVRPNNTNQEAGICIYKNGSSFRNGSNVAPTVGSQNGTIVSALVYANGSTDYFEIFVYVGSAATTSGNYQSTWFNGVLVRGA
jgi:hypothetical protein